MRYTLSRWTAESTKAQSESELSNARKELALVGEGGFQFMASMDAIRNELKHLTVETN